MDTLDFIGTLNEPEDPNKLIDEISELIYAFPLTDTQKIYIKLVLLPGLPDYEWTLEYQEYLSDPTNEDLANSVRNKLNLMIKVMIGLPEYNLS